ncbi:hypothetical protein FOL46_009948, partial [Perkinsus olseni]
TTTLYDTPHYHHDKIRRPIRCAMVIICPTAVRFLSASSSVSSISRTALPSFAIPLRPPVTHLVPSLSGPPPTLLPGQKMNEHSEERAEEGVLEEALRSMKRIRLDNTESNTTGSDDKQQQDDDVAAFEARQQLLQDEADAMSTISTASSMKRGRASEFILDLARSSSVGTTTPQSGRN